MVQNKTWWWNIEKENRETVKFDSTTILGRSSSIKLQEETKKTISEIFLFFCLQLKAKPMNS